MNILEVPFDEGSLGKNIGSKDAPRAIIKRLEGGHRSFLFKTSRAPCKGSLDEVYEEIYHHCKDAYIMLGGDHSITYSGFRAFQEKFKNPGLLIFDAHPDCEVSTSTVDHESFARRLIEDGLLKKENLILVGLRAFSENELTFLKENKIKCFPMDRIFGNVLYTCDSIMELCREFDGLYVSIDIDVVDPAFAPGTGYLEAGGLSSQEMLYFLRRVKLLKNMKFIDIVEVNPSKDNNGMTIELASKLLMELL